MGLILPIAVSLHKRSPLGIEVGMNRGAATWYTVTMSSVQLMVHPIPSPGAATIYSLEVYVLNLQFNDQT